MRKILIKFTALCIALISVLSMSGCIDSLFGPTYYPEEELTVYAGQGTTRYEYSEKVAVTLNNNDDDRLEINNFTELECRFEKVAYKNGKLFIVTAEIIEDDKYYMFDIDDYIENYNKDNNYLDYELHEYSFEEFENTYPDYDSYDWYKN